MANLPKENDCPFDCEHYDMEANGYIYQWCTHPDADDYIDTTEPVCPLGKWED